MTGWVWWLYLLLVVGGAVPAVWFPVQYGLSGLWRRSEMGAHLMTYSVLFGLLYVRTCVTLATATGQDQVRSMGVLQAAVVLLFAAGFAGVAWWRLALYHRAHRLDKKG